MTARSKQCRIEIIGDVAAWCYTLRAINLISFARVILLSLFLAVAADAALVVFCAYAPSVYRLLYAFEATHAPPGPHFRFYRPVQIKSFNNPPSWAYFREICLGFVLRP